MAARLQLIDEAAPAPQQHQPRVFTAAFRARLAQSNQAERALRNLGVHVLWARLDGAAPQVRIERKRDQSIAPLLDRMGPRSFRNGQGWVEVAGTFQGVTVSWLELATVTEKS